MDKKKVPSKKGTNTKQKSNKPKLSKKVIAWISAGAVAVAAILTFALTTIIGGGVFKKNTSVSIAQSTSDNTSAKVTWDSSKSISSVEINVTCNGNSLRTVKLTNNIDIKYGAYVVEGVSGKYTVTTTIKGNNFYQSKTVKQDVLAPVDEVNIAPLSATMPVLLFTLNNWDITNNGAIPTYAALVRSGAWDWRNLPTSVYALPTSDVTYYRADAANQSMKDRMLDETVTYVNYLLEANKDTKINFYINDFETYYYFELLSVLGDHPDQFTFTFLSDGSGSYNYFKQMYTRQKAYEAYATQLSQYNSTMEKVLETNNYDNKSGITVAQARYYTYVICNEEANCNWWLSNKDNLTDDRVAGVPMPTEPEGYSSMASDDPIKVAYDNDLSQQSAFKAGVSSNTSLINKSISSSLSAIQTDTTKTAQLKAVYNFNDEMFSHTPEGKKTMMLLGSRINPSSISAQGEGKFANWANFTMSYYGDDYVYYYKGHPGSPTDMFPERAELLDNLGIYDVDSTIAAELILFFFPDIYMTGFSSTTYSSVESPLMACGFWNSTMPSNIASQAVYYRYMDWFMSTTNSTTLNTSFGIDGLNSEHEYYLVQYNNYVGSSENGDSSTNISYYATRKAQNYDLHQVSVYDATTNVITYYKLVDSNYVQVTANGSAIA